MVLYLQSHRNNFLQQVTEGVELVSGNGDVKGVDVFQTVALMDCSSKWEKTLSMGLNSQNDGSSPTHLGM